VSPNGPTKYFKNAADILPIVGERGYCLGSKRITVDGARVGFLYREVPESQGDSGWHFMAGDESPEYCKNSSNFERYDVNTIANYDPEIIGFLDHPTGCEYDRAKDGSWRRLKSPDGKVVAIETLPDAAGHCALGLGWSVELPARFSRRIENSSEQFLWRRGITLIFTPHSGGDPHRALAGMVASRPRSATKFVDVTDHEVRRVSYLIVEGSGTAASRMMMGVAIAGDNLLIHQTSCDDEEGLSSAVRIWQSLRWSPGS
jgi:hypothetical protein